MSRESNYQFFNEEKTVNYLNPFKIENPVKLLCKKTA